jgi:hypothetical protein
MRQLEHNLQKSCVNFFRLKYPNYSRLLIAIPNGGVRDIITGKRLKEEGVVAGAPDLFLFIPNDGFHGLAIEMKSEKGRLTESQALFQAELLRQNYCYEVVRSIDDFITAITGYLRNIEMDGM